MRRSCMLFAFLSLAALAFADGGFDVKPGLRLWGADVAVGYSLPSSDAGVHTRFVAQTGAGWQKYGYYRDPNGLMLDSPQSQSVVDSGVYHNIDISWGLGVEQGILPGGTDGNLLKAFVFYDGRWDDHLKAGSDQLIFASGRPDAGEFLGHSFLGGLAYSTLGKNRVTKVQHGFYAEASGEWGPSALQYASDTEGKAPTSSGSLEFFRWNVTAKKFFPLMELEQGGQNLMSLYAGSFLSGDYATSNKEVPQYVRQTFGGTNPRVGLADAVRGFEPYRFDANLKFVNNNEVRFVGPGFFMPDLNPILIAYFDQGWYKQVGEGISNPASDYLAVVGFGVFGNAFDLGQAGIYLNYALTPSPLKANSRLNLSLDFGLKF
jgi:hypothetical protein